MRKDGTTYIEGRFKKGRVREWRRQGKGEKGEGREFDGVYSMLIAMRKGEERVRLFGSGFGGGIPQSGLLSFFFLLVWLDL